MKWSCEPTRTPLNVDIAALQQRYRQERDKRLRLEGERQYVETSDDFSDFYEVDPYSPPIERDPISEDLDVAILGGGFAGLLTAARVKEAGIDDIRIIEMGGDFGGAWYWNRYPGVQCDIESYCWCRCSRRSAISPNIAIPTAARFSSSVSGSGATSVCTRRPCLVPWLDRFAGMHRFSAGDGPNRRDDFRARFLVMASGPYNREAPAFPASTTSPATAFTPRAGIIESTGGDTTGGLDKLADKRVAIIGTGATAVQVVPFLGRYSKHLHVFQRTPSTIDDRGNRVTDSEWAKTLTQGWQAERQKSFHVATFEQLYPGMSDLVCDGWTEINRNLQATLARMGDPSLSPEEYLRLREREDYQVMERLRERIDSVVKDKETAEKLKPYYRFLCKRPCFNDDYLPTFNRPNVTLVNVSSTRGVERLTDKGVVANGVEYEVDCIVYASGFEITTEMKRRIGIERVEGRGGRSLYDHWANGFKTLHGFMTHGFPNQLFTGFIQGGVSVNVTVMYDHQARHMAYIIKET